jgi:hypothetical protein
MPSLLCQPWLERARIAIAGRLPHPFFEVLQADLVERCTGHPVCGCTTILFLGELLIEDHAKWAPWGWYPQQDKKQVRTIHDQLTTGVPRTYLRKNATEATERRERVIFGQNMVLAVSALDKALEEKSGSSHGFLRGWPAWHPAHLFLCGKAYQLPVFNMTSYA